MTHPLYTYRSEDEDIIDTALDTLAWQRRQLDILKAELTDTYRDLAKALKGIIPADVLEGISDRTEAMDALIAQDACLIDVEPVACRYGFDGYGWQYIDNGSGSDWMTRHPDAEPLYTRPPVDAALLDEVREALRDIADHAEPEDSEEVWYCSDRARAALAKLEGGA